jgi:hypothetical protein
MEIASEAEEQLDTTPRTPLLLPARRSCCLFLLPSSCIHSFVHIPPPPAAALTSMKLLQTASPH